MFWNNAYHKQKAIKRFKKWEFC